MNRAAKYVADRLSLREPQAKSLELLASVAELIPLRKESDPAHALALIKEKFPSVESFERDFPSLCFALATGVGKTRLMGAFIAYLVAEKGIRNFFVLAPNLTIYNKLEKDFTPGQPKYVFAGLSDFAVTPPLLITGDNYATKRIERKVEQGDLFDTAVRINIFNISKLDKDANDKSGLPRIKRLSEVLGESYFDYLKSLPDLVLLMDESHRYRASAGVRALNELRPVLGLELTATPQIETAKGAVPFKNIIYSYPLADALRDGFVKEPVVATRKDFIAKDYDEAALEKLKLEDAVRVHESVKVQLEVYARDRETKLVKPFILVIAKDTDHARALEQVIKSDEFFNGRYKDRVIQVHSKLRGEESEETVERLLKVEDPNEPTEIVIHVNMLKEGWDVTNLYTIVPLRKADSKTLIEQSIGRGLRLPFGKRTGIAALDWLTIIAHDNFQALIDEAKSPDSALRTGLRIVEIPQVGSQVATVPSMIEARIFGSGTLLHGTDGVGIAPEGAGPAPEAALNTPEKVALGRLALRQIEKLSRDPRTYAGSGVLEADETQSLITSLVFAEYGAQPALPGLEAMTKQVVSLVCKSVVAGTIDIPRITVVPEGEESGYKDFDLDVSRLELKPVEETILRKMLRDSSIQDELGIDRELAPEDLAEKYILRAMFEFNEIDYTANSALLNKLAKEAVAKLRSYLTNAEVFNVVQYHQRTLAELIRGQMRQHFWKKAIAYQAHVSQGFQPTQGISFTVPDGEVISALRAPVAEKIDIRNRIFGGLKKCLYPLQKFQSDAERRFAIVLEDDKTVEKWCKPSPKAFPIDYAPGKQYEPDFVAETKIEKLLCEVKRADQIGDEIVQAKARAAVAYCAHASVHAAEHGAKPWRYLLIPDHRIAENASLKALADLFAQ